MNDIRLQLFEAMLSLKHVYIAGIQKSGNIVAIGIEDGSGHNLLVTFSGDARRYFVDTRTTMIMITERPRIIWHTPTNNTEVW